MVVDQSELTSVVERNRIVGGFRASQIYADVHSLRNSSGLNVGIFRRGSKVTAPTTVFEDISNFNSVTVRPEVLVEFEKGGEILRSIEGGIALTLLIANVDGGRRPLAEVVIERTLNLPSFGGVKMNDDGLVEADLVYRHAGDYERSSYDVARFTYEGNVRTQVDQFPLGLEKALVALIRGIAPNK